MRCRRSDPAEAPLAGESAETEPVRPDRDAVEPGAWQARRRARLAWCGNSGTCNGSAILNVLRPGVIARQVYQIAPVRGCAVRRRTGKNPGFLGAGRAVAAGCRESIDYSVSGTDRLRLA